MKILLSQLGDFLDLTGIGWSVQGEPAPAMVSLVTDALNTLGMVVESFEVVPNHLARVEAARVLSISAIEGADHIRLVTVECSDPDPVQVVCGAENFSVGDIVPFARVGALLPGGFAISRRRMKGVESNGMLCSAREVELGEDSGGLLLLDGSFEVGVPLSDALGIHWDVLFDLAIEANRPDANCVLGVARDLAPALGLRFQPTIHVAEVEIRRVDAGPLAVAVSNPALCRRLLVAEFEQALALQDAFRLRRRLKLCGMRSVSDVVDASNYVMLELGQPSHPYDFDLLDRRGVAAREALDGEVLETLDGTVRHLQGGVHAELPGDIVIVDHLDRVVGLAGVMGGRSTEITGDTTSVLLELASFDRGAISRTSKRLGLRSEASARFERGVDPQVATMALGRIAHLLGVDRVVGSELVNDHFERVVIPVRVARVEQILGVAISSQRVTELLAPLGFTTPREADGSIEVLVPTFRPDCVGEIDIVEEIARHFGYERIGRAPISSPFVGVLTPEQRDLRKLRSLLRDIGLNEILGAALLSPSDQSTLGLTDSFISVENPMVQEESVIRRTLMVSFMRALGFNLARRAQEVSLFEIGHVVTEELDRDSPLPHESIRLGVLQLDPENGARPVVETLSLIASAFSFVDLSIENHDGTTFADVEEFGVLRGSWPSLHGGRAGIVRVDGIAVGVVGEVDGATVLPFTHGLVKGRVGYLEIDLEMFLRGSRRSDRVEEISSYTSTDLDLAFEVPEKVSALDLCRLVGAAIGEIVRAVELFDVFRSERIGPGRKSLAVRARLESLTGSISEEELSACIARAADAVAASFGGTLRGA